MENSPAPSGTHGTEGDLVFAAEPHWAPAPAPHPLRRAADWPAARVPGLRGSTPRTFPEGARAHPRRRASDRITTASHAHRPAPRRSATSRRRRTHAIAARAGGRRGDDTDGGPEGGDAAAQALPALRPTIGCPTIGWDPS